MQNTERWKPARGFEKYYEVSNLGYVRSLGRSISRKNGTVGFRAGSLVLASSGPYGHLQVMLYVPSKKPVCRTVHSLILETFTALRDRKHKQPKYVCAHLNGVPSDNRLENLRWVSSKTNAAHKLLHGTNGRKLTLAQAHQIRFLFPQLIDVPPSVRYRSLASDFGVSAGTIRGIINNKTWGGGANAFQK